MLKVLVIPNFPNGHFNSSLLKLISSKIYFIMIEAVNFNIRIVNFIAGSYFWHITVNQ